MRAMLGAVLLLTSAPLAAQDMQAPHMQASSSVLPAVPLSDAELATLTGKFILPSGGSLALSVTSDTLLNGTLVLRTVLTVDQGSNVQVFARGEGTAAPAATASGDATPGWPMLTNGVSVLFDRRSGAQITLPTVSTIRAGTATDQSAGPGGMPGGIVPVAVVAGGPAVQTPDGLVSLTAVPNGSQVTLAGDQIGIAHLVGQSVATAILNTGNDRTIDTVTTIGIDLHDAAALAMGSAAMKVDALVADVSRGLVR